MKPDAPVGPILDAVVKHAFEATKCACRGLLLHVLTALVIITVFLLQAALLPSKGLCPLLHEHITCGLKLWCCRQHYVQP